ncbi:MAG: ATP-dependent Clp protease adaptor ClpS [Planctomycetota bacterium]|nr:MAG: ATP-dependent Clp protease adaptor ClpS [Planctomycetota bacterium]REJ91493.1 MAG: ATP-dependent Clp protease adaptor ClpS [Planctomycetota bacterium]REK26959.1 MAG: ATP-dependent Clp protease adaptor ClpS [Planctomycetota bacterium]REK44315.1 MAG: ATP-dependent Clp protease adaptor ClpS [Planctomycetota bacterium]
MEERSAAAVLAPSEERVAQEHSRAKRQPPYHVILWDDDDHSYQYVMVMLQQLFGHRPVKGFELAEEVDTRGRAIVLTTTREHAELKRDQIHAFGRDESITRCQGAMSASIEPAHD